MRTYSVPFTSQYTDIGHQDWKSRGCGIASLHMVLAYWHGVDQKHKLPTVDELLERGRALDAYEEDIGWTHGGLVKLAHEYGFDGHNEDFGPKSPHPKNAQDAWEELAHQLEGGPVMTSVYAGLDPARGGGHIVVVTGAGDGLVYFNDPQEHAAQEGCRVLDLQAFLHAFKCRFIVVHPA